MSELGVGIIGAGRIGRVHVANIIRNLPEVRIAGVADPYLNRGWLTKLGIPMGTESAEDLLDLPDVSAVIIATPTATHIPMIRAAARAGKHIFCEKPLAFDPSELEEIRRELEETGVKFQVGYNRRFDPTIRKLSEGVRAGQVGDIHIVKIFNRDPKPPPFDFLAHSGGIFIDLAIHDFDLVRFLTSSEVESVYATGAAQSVPELESIGDVDLSLTTLRLRNGAVCSVVNSRESVTCYDQRIEVFGSRGSLSTANRSPTSTLLQTGEGAFREHSYYNFSDRYREAFIGELSSFFTAIQTDTAPLVGIGDARAALQIAFAARQSLHEDRPVTIDEMAAGRGG